MSENSSTIDFTEHEKKIGRILYFILVVCIIASIAGLGWTILDIIQPTGKLETFLQGNAGLKLVLLGIAAFILFLMLIAFYGMRRRGIDLITRVVFTAKRVYRDMKVPKMAQFTTGGLIVSIFVMALGGIWLMIQIILDYVFNTSSASGDSSAVPKLLLFLDALTAGELFMIIAVFCLCLVFIIILFAWLGNAGNIFFARTFLKIPISPEKFASTPGTESIPVRTAKQTFSILGVIFGFAGVAFYGYSLESLISGSATITNDYNMFHHWLQSVSFFGGFGAVVFMIALFFTLIARKKLLSLVIILSFVIGVIAAVYIDLWRPLGDPPVNPWNDTTLLNFEILVGVLLCIGIVGFVIIVVVQATAIKNVKKATITNVTNNASIPNSTSEPKGEDPNESY
ncbi:MAG TPA: hypothetical protein VKM55_16580 [Candidatus Lokiarchaeia archaeon]|nr:hypothetical protein [Candidatus Lokiarchaeia archaeon]